MQIGEEGGGELKTLEENKSFIPCLYLHSNPFPDKKILLCKMHTLYLVGKLKGGEWTFPKEAEILYEIEQRN